MSRREQSHGVQPVLDDDARDEKTVVAHNRFAEFDYAEK